MFLRPFACAFDVAIDSACVLTSARTTRMWGNHDARRRPAAPVPQPMSTAVRIPIQTLESFENGGEPVRVRTEEDRVLGRRWIG